MNNIVKAEATVTLSDGSIVELRKPTWRESGYIVNQLVALGGNMFDPHILEYVTLKCSGWTDEILTSHSREDVDIVCQAATDLAFDDYVLKRISSYKKKFDEILESTTFGISKESFSGSSENQDSPAPIAKP